MKVIEESCNAIKTHYKFDEKEYKYYVIDESGDLFIFELLEIKNKVNLNNKN